MNAREFGDFVFGESRKVISGQQQTVEEMLVCFLAGGHVLLEGVPGIAKTLMARTMARILGCEFTRIQFTPDLMPSDITGTYVYDMNTAEFRLKKGPVFTNVLLADEVNRTPPKTQSALLQAMEERCVSFDGVDHYLGDVFFVIATQNPVEYEGTYPLPEAQLDRFLMKVMVDYPQAAEEIEVVRRSHEGFDSHNLEAAGVQTIQDAAIIGQVKADIGKVTVDDPVIAYAVAITRRTRELHQVVLGGSPRASLAMIRCAKVLAALRGREFATPDDVKTVATPVLRHRLILSAESVVEGVKPDEVIEGALTSVMVPR